MRIVKYVDKLALCWLLGMCASAWSVTLQGIVEDYKGDPLSSAQVWVSHDRQVYRSQSGADGKFVFHNLARGKIEVVAMKDGHSLGGVEGQLLGDMSVTVRLDKGKDLRVRVINGNYEPIEGARLKSMFVNESFTVNVEDLSQHGFPTIISDAQGVMTVPSMPMFGYTSLATSHPGYAEGMLPTFPIGTDVDLVMNPGIKVRGRVMNEGGDGVARARVSLSRQVQDKAMKFAEVLSDADGFYTVNVPPAKYFVTAMHQDYAIARPRSFDVEAGADEVLADVTMQEAHFVTGRFVMSDSGAAVPSAKVEYRDDQNVVFAETLSDVNGQFRVKVPSGQGSLVIIPPERLMTSIHNVLPLNIRDDRESDVGTIGLEPLPAIWGTVVDIRREPVANAYVRTLNSDPPVITRTNENGEYYIQLEKMIDAEKLEIYAEHPLRFQREVRKIEMNDAGRVNIELHSYRPLVNFMPELARNNLSDLLNESAPALSCTEWFNLPDDKKTLTLDELQGKIVVLTFWAGFDMSKRSQDRMEELKYLYSVFGDDPNVAFIGVHDASLEPYEIELVVRGAEIPFPVGCDSKQFDSFRDYKVNQIPQTVLINPSGLVQYYEVDGRLHTLVKAMLRAQ